VNVLHARAGDPDEIIRPATASSLCNCLPPNTGKGFFTGTTSRTDFSGRGYQQIWRCLWHACESQGTEAAHVNRFAAPSVLSLRCAPTLAEAIGRITTPRFRDTKNRPEISLGLVEGVVLRQSEAMMILVVHARTCPFVTTVANLLPARSMSWSGRASASVSGADAQRLTVRGRPTESSPDPPTRFLRGEGLASPAMWHLVLVACARSAYRFPQPQTAALECASW